MTDTVKYLLDETRIPKYWYNLVADLPVAAAAGAASGHACSRWDRTIWRRCFRWN